MDLKEFAATYRLRLKNNGAESLIHGKFGELADMGDEGRLRLRLLAVPRHADMDRTLRSRRKAALDGGLQLKWKGEAESIFYFDPADAVQVSLAVKLVGARVRRATRVLTTEQRQALSDRLAAGRARKAALTVPVLAENSHVEAPVQDLGGLQA